MKNKKLTLLLILISAVLAFRVFSAENQGKESREKYITEGVFGTKVYIYDSGDRSKESVILVHGLGDDAAKIWKGLIPVLEKKYNVVTFDLPGFGRSQKDNKLYSPENYARFVKWAADKYTDGKIYIIGHSMGGAISLYYAWMYPETVRRLVLVDAAGILHRAAFTKNIAKIEIEEIKNLPNPLGYFNYAINTAIEKVDDNVPQDMSLVLENDLLRKKMFGGEPQKIASMALIQTNFCEQAYNIRTPVSIIWGDIDPIAPLRTAKMLSFLIPGTDINFMRGVGHNPMIDDPGRFNALVMDTLTKDAEKTGKNPDDAAGSPVYSGQSVFEKEDGLKLKGNYGSIRLVDCKNVVISDVETGSIEITNSWVELENVRVKSADTGLTLVNSVISVTGAVITAGTAISTSNSKIDLAGVRLTCGKRAVISVSAEKSTIVFSICEVKSPARNGYIHDIVSLGEGEKL